MQHNDTSECVGGWNITASAMTFNSADVMPVADTAPTVQMQTGYPYIGLDPNSFQAAMQTMTDQNPDYVTSQACTSTFCFWAYTECSELDLSGEFTIQLGDYEYSIAIKDFAGDVAMSDTRNDCDLYLATLSDDNTNVIRLGDVFISSFLTVFDIE